MCYWGKGRRRRCQGKVVEVAGGGGGGSPAFFWLEDRGVKKGCANREDCEILLFFCSKSGHFARIILCLVLYVGESHKHYNNDCSSPPLPYFPLFLHRERGRHERGKFVLSHTSFSPPFLLPGHHKNLFFSPPTAIHSCLSLPVRRRCKRFSNFGYIFYIRSNGNTETAFVISLKNQNTLL